MTRRNCLSSESGEEDQLLPRELIGDVGFLTSQREEVCTVLKRACMEKRNLQAKSPVINQCQGIEFRAQCSFVVRTGLLLSVLSLLASHDLLWRFIMDPTSSSANSRDGENVSGRIPVWIDCDPGKYSI